MKKLVFLLFFFPLTAFAQPVVRLNHTLPQYRLVHDPLSDNRFFNDVKTNSYLKNIYADGSSGTLEQIARIADQSLQQIDIDRIVPSLINGKITADISNMKTVSRDGISAGLSGGYPIYNGEAGPYITSQQHRFQLLTMPSGNDIPTTSTHNIPYQDMLTLGGLLAEDKMFFNVSGQPYGGGQMGVVDQVFMDGANITQGTGITAGGWQNMLSYPNFDAAARGTVVKSAPPYFIASSSIKDPDGNSHAVTFTKTGAKFFPALPKYWGKKLRINMNVATNEIGATLKNFPTSNWSESWSNHARRFFNIYVGTIIGWHTQSDETVDSITVDGWVVPAQEKYGLGSREGKTPGTDTLDGSVPKLDTTFTHIAAPSIFFGVYTKQFIAYDLCDLEGQHGHGDINNPNGTLGSLVHECDHERDLWNHDPTDYVNSIHGMTIVEDNTGGGKLTDDSFLMSLSGGGAMPVGLQIWNVKNNAPLIQMFGNGTRNRYNIYSPTPLPLNKNDFFVSQVSQYSLEKGGNYTASIRWAQYRDVTIQKDKKNNDWSTSSIHLQFQQDNEENPTTSTGAPGGQLVFNPAGYRWGIGLGSTGSLQYPNYGLIIDSSGHAVFPNGVKGNVISSGIIMAKGGIGTIPSSFQSFGVGLFDGQEKWCSNCKKNGVIGLPLYWHTSNKQWFDSTNQKPEM